MAQLVGVIMGSQSDWPKVESCPKLLDRLGISHECRIVSAHRTPDWLDEYAKTAVDRGLKVIIAAAGGAAHLPGMAAGKTRLPVIGIPIQSSVFSGLDSLYSIVQMPPGVPVGTMAVGAGGAINAALYAAAILALSDEAIAASLEAYRADQTAAVMAQTDPALAYAATQKS